MMGINDINASSSNADTNGTNTNAGGNGNNERFSHHPDDEFTSSEDDDYVDGDDDVDAINSPARPNDLNASNESKDSAYSPCSSFLVYRLGTKAIEPPPGSSLINAKTIEVCINSLLTENDDTITNCTSQVILQIIDGSILLVDLKTKQLMIKVNISQVISWAACDRHFAFVTSHDIIIDKPRESCDVSNVTNDLEACALTPQSNESNCHIFRCEDDGLESAAVTISSLLEKERSKVTTADEFYIEDDYLNPKSTISTPDVEFFPTPVEEPCKTIRAIFLGSIVVSEAAGIDVLNNAIDCVVNQLHNQKSYSYDETSEDEERENRRGASQRLRRSKTWTLSPCDVKISSSTVIISAAISGETIVDARLRYISFMGIGRSDVRKCAFILRTGENEFTAFILQCDPDAGLLCRTLETACKLRFQKCMDAHRLRSSASADTSSTNKFGVFKRSPSLQAVKKAISNVFWNK